MKTKRWFTVLFLSSFFVIGFSQKNEIKVMYSPVSLQQMDNWGKDLDGLNAKHTGTFMIDYNRYVKPRLKVGLNIAYDHKEESGSKTDGYRNPHPPYDWISTTNKQTNKEGWFFIGPQVGYEYIQKENFRLGSLVGVSLVIMNKEDVVEKAQTEKTTDVNLFFHAEVINFTWGNNYGLTGQLGYGHKGLISVGGFVRW